MEHVCEDNSSFLDFNKKGHPSAQEEIGSRFFLQKFLP